jgi:predicted kinase
MSDEPRAASLVLITGIMAAGKSTVAERLAARFPRAVHVRGDVFRRAIVAGREEMTPDPSPAALEQLRLRYRLMASVADSYVAAGFTTVAQDVIIGPMLREVVGMFSTPNVELVVLAPSLGAVMRREETRSKVGYRDFTAQDLDQVLRHETPRLGTWIDSSDQTPEETVDAIFRLALA